MGRPLAKKGDLSASKYGVALRSCPERLLPQSRAAISESNRRAQTHRIGAWTSLALTDDSSIRL